MTNLLAIYLNFCLSLFLLVPVVSNDWTEWRGPARDGVSPEKGLPTAWSPGGQNLAWKAPFGGRSAPVLVGDPGYLQNTPGKGGLGREAVMCCNADNGK